MNRILKSLKGYFAEMGLFAGIFGGIFMCLAFVLLFPFFLIEYINYVSKSWFGGSSDA